MLMSILKYKSMSINYYFEWSNQNINKCHLLLLINYSC